jgi:ribosomal protein S18 acetylase RimI-like enzyme
MKSTVNNKRYIIEFKYIAGQDRIEDIKKLFLEYAKSLKVDLAFQNFQAEFKALPGKYGPPQGILILAIVDGEAAGCIAVRKIFEDTCEMKRLYVRDDYRGLGIGKRLINIILKEASGLNYHYIRLDTLPTMVKAQALYTSLGFYDIKPYVYNPIKGTRFMELKLKN